MKDVITKIKEIEILVCENSENLYVAKSLTEIIDDSILNITFEDE